VAHAVLLCYERCTGCGVCTLGFIVFLWGAGVVICLERCADLHMVQLMPLPLTVSCFSKILIGFTFLVPAHLGIPGQRAIKRVCVRVFVASLLLWAREAGDISRLLQQRW